MLPIVVGIFIAFAAYLANDCLAGRKYYKLNSTLSKREPSFFKWWLRHDWLELTLFGIYAIVLVVIVMDVELPSFLKKMNPRVKEPKLLAVEAVLLAYLVYDYFSARLFFKREIEMKTQINKEFREWWLDQNGIRLAIAVLLLLVLLPFVFSLF